MMGHKMTADEAFANGLVTRVFPDDQFEEKVKEIVDQLGTLPPMVCWTYKKINCRCNNLPTSFCYTVCVIEYHPISMLQPTLTAIINLRVYGIC